MARWILALPVALGVMVLNVVIFVLFMVVYGNAINPGHPEAFYHEYAKQAGPYSSIIAGIPLMFLAGRWYGKKFNGSNCVKAALLIWLIYFVIDLVIIAFSGELINILALFIVSFSTKFLGAYFGGKSAMV